MSEKLRESIKKANMKFSEHIRAGNAKELAGLYTEDAHLLPTNSDMIQGRESVEEFWGGAISGLGIKDAKLTTLEVYEGEDSITEVGEYLLHIQPEGQEAAEDRGKYVVIWKETPEGLKLHRDIWNTSQPP